MMQIEEMSYNELIETHETQKKMIANRYVVISGLISILNVSLCVLHVLTLCLVVFIRGILQKLPDKGEKLKESIKKIEAQILELEKQQKVSRKRKNKDEVESGESKQVKVETEETNGNSINKTEVVAASKTEEAEPVPAISAEELDKRIIHQMEVN